jgi:hypothetical protein
MKDRVFISGLMTTILGIGCMCGAIYMYMSTSFTSMEAAELGALGLVFLRSKDSLIGLGPKS